MTDKEAGRPLGYGSVDARPPVDGDPQPVPGKGAGGSESDGGAFANNAGSESAGNVGQGYSGLAHAEQNAVRTDKAD